ncbi:hypothetical protein LENED_011718 [Lentinula edodes]|uniref:Uncharacterized protein n=1 Tax=Lentinula edodes TaxID=5353 RepID=A0A1Q3EQT3_LENED|nr:hypothetical protein LENED_011718 [Lentinula edodes]
MSTRKKSQRKRIPAALHSELTEYSSLLRSLRTNDNLDVTSQLTRYFNHKGKEKAQIYDDDDSECINDGDVDFKDVGSDVEEELVSDVEAGSSCKWGFFNKKGTRTRSEKTGRYIRVTVTPTYNCRVIQQKSCQYGNNQLERASDFNFTAFFLCCCIIKYSNLQLVYTPV